MAKQYATTNYNDCQLANYESLDLLELVKLTCETFTVKAYIYLHVGQPMFFKFASSACFVFFR